MHRLALVLAVTALFAGCANTVDVTPVNVATSELRKQPPFVGESEIDDDVVLGLAFSGGGTRAAAFAHGVLSELNATAIGRRRDGTSLADAVDVVSGVSGGSVTATYFAWKHKAALADFREKFLLRNVEAELRTDIDLTNLLTAWRYGGVNDRKGLPRWLEANLFGGATFAEIMRRNRPSLLVNASDIYNRIPFVFSYEMFNALCSDLDSYPLSDAVAASAAVPIAFTPVVLQAFPQACDYPTPFWLERALKRDDAALGLRALAKGLRRYRDPSLMRYVKLVDGGVTDNFGLQGFILSRAAATTPYRPLTPERAARLKRFVFLVVDAGRGPAGDWAKEPIGPSGLVIAQAVTDTAIDTNVRQSYDNLRMMLQNWQRELIAWRCNLPPAEVARLRGSTAGWNCRDVQIEADLVDFRGAGEDIRPRLDAVPTTLNLPEDQVDFVIAAGRTSLRANPTYRRLVTAIGARPAAAEVAQR